jgi:ribonuclease PH
LRAVVNLEALGENQISLDCDVIQADGGTRTAAITGAWVALYLCVAKMKADGLMSTPVMGGVISDHVAALSCGIYQGLPVADLDYDEDSVADTDGNFVMTGSGKLVEIQATAEGEAFDEAEFQTLMDLAKTGIAELVALQKQAVGL